MKSPSFSLWALTAVGALVIALIGGYAVINGSGHTGWEPLKSLALFVPLAFFGGVGLAMRRRAPRLVPASLSALLIGLAGITLIVTLDQTNHLVEYHRWIRRGMP